MRLALAMDTHLFNKLQLKILIEWTLLNAMNSFIAYFKPPTILGILIDFMVICASKFDKKYAQGSNCIGN